MEIWKDVKGYEGSYQVSNIGRVKSLDRLVQSRYGMRKTKGVLLKLTLDKDGYTKLNLKISQVSKSKRVHRLVAGAFIENPQNKPQVNHINGVKNDNRLDNLEWSTLSENRQHAYDTGLQNGKNRRGQKSNFNKLTGIEVLKIKKLLAKGCRQKEIASFFNVSQGCISLIKTKQNWAWL